jgi:hypothetical protein
VRTPTEEGGLALSIFVFRAIALTFFVMLATLVMADVEVVRVVVAPMPIFATVVLGWHTVTQIAGSLGRVVPTMSLFS